MTATQAWRFASDHPLTSLTDDQFSRVPYANQLIHALQHLPDNSVVVGLEGTWGSGKTTVLAFALETLKNKSEGLGPIILEFNPWWYTGREDLSQQFFNALAKAVTEENSDPAKPELSKILRLLGLVAKPTKALFTVFNNKEGGELLGSVLEGISSGKEFFKDHPSMYDLKKAADASLAELHRPVWVLLDDIDRLLPVEALEVLTLIRGVGDLPNIRYVLAYDRNQLERRIAVAIGGDDSDAREYINKIVQLSFPIPDPHPVQLQRAFEEQLGDLHGAQGLSLASLRVALEPAMGILICTPRDVKRLVNAYAITRGLVGHELNAEDVLRLELLRLEFPRLYQALPRHREYLIGQGGRDVFERRRSEALNRLIESNVPEELRPVVATLLTASFPMLGGKLAWETLLTTSENVFMWQEKRRVTSEALFDCFFQRGISEELIKVDEIVRLENFLGAGDVRGFSALLKELSAIAVPGAAFTRAALAVEHAFGSLLSNRVQTRSETFVEALCNVGDQLQLRVGDDATNVLGGYIARITNSIVDRSGSAVLEDWTRDHMIKGDSLATCCATAFNLEVIEPFGLGDVDFKKALKDRIEVGLQSHEFTSAKLNIILEAWLWTYSELNPHANALNVWPTQVAAVKVKEFTNDLLRSDPVKGLLLMAQGPNWRACLKPEGDLWKVDTQALWALYSREQVENALRVVQNNVDVGQTFWINYKSLI